MAARRGGATSPLTAIGRQRKWVIRGTVARMNCPRCGAGVPPGYPACPNCRLPLGPPPPPPPPATPPPPPPVAPYRRIRPLTGRAIAASLFIAVSAVAGLVDAFVPLLGVWAAREVADSGGTGAVDAFLLVRNLMLVAEGLLAIPAGICFVVWLYRARANLIAFPDAYPRLSPGLTIGAWFIPVANLLLPAFVVADTARESVPADEPRRRRRLRALVWFWWISYIGASIVAYAALFGGSSSEEAFLEGRLRAGETVDLGRARDLYGADVVAQLPGAMLWLLAAVLVIMVMHRITAAQYDRMDALRYGGTPPIPQQRTPAPASEAPEASAGATIGA